MKIIGIFCGVALFALAALLMGCGKDSPVEQAATSPPGIYGDVIDTTGKAIDSVAVHWILHFDKPITVQGMTKPLGTILLEFDLHDSGTVTVVVLRYGTNAVMDTVVDEEEMSAGRQSVEAPSWLTNGVYYYTVYLNGALVARYNFIVNDTDINQLTDAEPFTRSSKTGNFAIPASAFAVGVPFTRVLPGGGMDTVHVTSTADLVLYKPGYQTLVRQIEVDTAKAQEIKLTMRK